MLADVDDVFWPQFRLIPPEIGPPSGEIHVWSAKIDHPIPSVDQLLNILDEAERFRADTYQIDRDRRRFIVRRAILRTLLGHYTGVGPGSLQFHYGPQGKPGLATSTPVFQIVHFSVSHSDGLSLYAFTLGRELGVDVERIRQISDADSISEKFFSHRERSLLSMVPRSQKQEAFFNCWTRKEAYVKATGDGITAQLDHFDVSVALGEPARLINLDGDPIRAAAWALYDLKLAENYTGALAIKSSKESLVLREYTCANDLAGLHSNFEYGGQALLGLTPGASGW